MQVILVDHSDHPKGEAEKLAAHQKGLCHRAFSVFLFKQQADGIEALLQQRHIDKYHCGGLWSNACCSHPQPGQETAHAAQQRLMFEMDIEAPLTYTDKFHYIAKFENGLTENEVDHVFVGQYNGPIDGFNQQEVQASRWISIEDLQRQLEQTPEQFTPWLKPALAVALSIDIFS